jgi:hypothetical protein
MQECLDQNTLTAADGSREFPIEQANHRLSISLKAQLPPGLTCQRYEEHKQVVHNTVPGVLILFSENP